jgi:hypothetical protein
MDARREVINAIRQMIKFTPSPYREVFNLPQVMLPKQDEIPPMHAFLRPSPDVEGREEHPQEHGLSMTMPTVS